MKKIPKKLGVLDGAALVFANVVGVGIFITPGIVAQGVPNSGFLLLAWLIGGVYAIIGALGYARLSEKYPKAGGEYIYLKNAFGSIAGFLSGWTSFVAGFSGAIAASAVGFSIYLVRINPSISNTFLGTNTQTLLAIGLIVLVAVIHVLSVKGGSRFHYWLVSLAIITILFLVLTGLSSNQNVPEVASDPFHTSSFLFAMIPILFTFSGWNAAVYISEEVQSPERNVRKALLIGTGSVILIYLLLNLTFVKILGLDQMRNSLEVGYDMSQKLLGTNGSVVITIIILLALLSSVSAMIMAGPRIYFAMGRDGVFPKKMMTLHKKFRTPHIAILAQSVWSVLLVLSGTFEDILIYTGFSIILFSGLAILSLLLNKEISIAPTMRLLYWIFILISLAILVNGIITAPKPTLLGAAIILLGIPVHSWFKRKRSM